MDLIINRVAEIFNISPKEIKGKSRKDSVVKARQVVMYIAWQSQYYTLSEIGCVLGNRVPATVGYGYQIVANNIYRNRHFRDRIKLIQEQCFGR